MELYPRKNWERGRQTLDRSFANHMANLCCFSVFKWKDRGLSVCFDWPLSSFDRNQWHQKGLLPNSTFHNLHWVTKCSWSLSHSPTISFFSFINCASKTGPLVAVKLGPGLQIAAHCIPGARSRGKAKRNRERHTHRRIEDWEIEGELFDEN